MFTFRDQDGNDVDSSDDEDLLIEPDDEDEDPTAEQSVAGAVAGVTTPLGAGPTYPNKNFKKPKSPAYITGRAFGGAAPLSSKKGKSSKRKK